MNDHRNPDDTPSSPSDPDRRARIVAGLARDLAREARGALWHWDQVATPVVTAKLYARAERIRCLAIGVVELDDSVRPSALEAMAREVTEMLDAIRRARCRTAQEPRAARAARAGDAPSSSSGSWPLA